ncbi:MAG: hypothetical protein Q4D38_03030 [Planctomycetia bacterium]|nr:hypothetical protein [Planctomycetia bacterium]
MMRFSTRARAFVWLLLVLIQISTGCRSYYRQMGAVRYSFYQNDLIKAESSLQKVREKRNNGKSDDLICLETATLKMCAGDFREAERLLRKTRDSFDRLENQKARKAGETTLSMLSDDMAISYAGEDYEKIMIRAMLAISSLMMDGSDAVAYSNQINLKQQEIISKSEINPDTGKKSKESYRFVSLGPYIRGILNDASALNQQEVIRSFTQVCEWSPNFYGGKEYLERAKQGYRPQKGHGVVHVFLLLGEGPHKVEVDAPVTQMSLLLADQIVSATSKHSVPPTFASVPIAAVLDTPCPYESADVLINGTKRAQTETLVDVNRMAVEQFEVNKPWIIARAVARRVVKKATVYGAKEATDTDSFTGELLFDIAGLMWEAAEEADTRCWSTLPGKIQVARLELPAGRHQISLTPNTRPYIPPNAQRYVPGVSVAWEGGNSPSGPPHEKNSRATPGGKTIQVEDGRDTFVFAYIARDGLIGDIHVGEAGSCPF